MPLSLIPSLSMQHRPEPKCSFNVETFHRPAICLCLSGLGSILSWALLAWMSQSHGIPSIHTLASCLWMVSLISVVGSGHSTQTLLYTVLSWETFLFVIGREGPRQYQLSYASASCLYDPCRASASYRVDWLSMLTATHPTKGGVHVRASVWKGSPHFPRHFSVMTLARTSWSQ